MAAIDNKHLVDIIAINKETGVSKRSGQPWEMYKAQCIVKGPEGLVKIGELIMPKHMIETTPGKYLVEFELDVSFERVIIPRITALHPWVEPGKQAPRPATDKLEARAA